MALIGTTTGAVVVILAAYFLSRQLEASQAALQRKAAAYGVLGARQVAPAVAFDDRETAREVFDAIAQDSDLESLVLFNAAGEILHARGAPGAWIEAARRGVQEQRIVELADRIAVVSPVVSAEGPRGTLVLELSTRELEATKTSMIRAAIAVGLGTMLLGMVLAYAIARSLGRRIGAVAQAAAAVAGGDLSQKPLAIGGRDEVAHLAGAFNVMVQQIQRLFTQLRENAASEKSRLEGLVQVRTSELDRRTADMRLVLDNVSQGFLTVGLDGQMSSERSAIIDTWLGAPQESETFFQYIDRTLPGKGDYLRVGWDALADDWMPLEMRLSQLPSEFRSHALHLGFAYQPIFEGDVFRKLLVIVSDIAPLAERQRSEDEEREFLQVVRKLLSDHNGFKEYVAEATQLVADITGDDPDMARRQRLLHTLKGNSAIFGFESIVRLCHELEDIVHTTGVDLGELDKRRLAADWDRLQDKVEALLRGRSAEMIELRRVDVQHVVANINAGARVSLIKHLINAWQLEPAGARFARLAEYAQALALRLEKAPLAIQIEGPDVRLHPEAWVGFWQSLVHVVRNAIDHGLEGPAARAAVGKPETGTLVFRARLAGGRLQLEIEDNGAGVDWAKVGGLARKRGLPADSRDQLVAALLSDGMSTRSLASHTSGRGIGLSAVRDACAAIGGRIAITSEPGRGTRFRFDFNVDAMGRPADASADGGQRVADLSYEFSKPISEVG